MQVATHKSPLPSKRSTLNSLECATSRELPTCKVLFTLLAVVGLASSNAHAVLGEDVASVQGDGVHINATVRSTPSRNYTIHELRSRAGVVVREYAAASGKVFAVAWQGPALPDMKQLLGSYFEEFQKAAQRQNRRGGHGPLRVQEPGLVVELGGHMRSFRGRAYIPEEVPTAMAHEEIR